VEVCQFNKLKIRIAPIWLFIVQAGGNFHISVLSRKPGPYYQPKIIGLIREYSLSESWFPFKFPLEFTNHKSCPVRSMSFESDLHGHHPLWFAQRMVLLKLDAVLTG
jgi:hypothetical protein